MSTVPAAELKAGDRIVVNEKTVTVTATEAFGYGLTEVTYDHDCGWGVVTLEEATRA
jgi:hypothetical protein